MLSLMKNFGEKNRTMYDCDKTAVHGDTTEKQNIHTEKFNFK